jgi:diacylglycerol kinase
MNPQNFSLKSRLQSFRFAFRGIRLIIKNEHNARIHLVSALIVVVLGIVLRVNLFEWCLLAIAIGIVFITELVNSSIETLADIVNPSLNNQIRNVKDYSAAAVLISAIIALVTGCLIFIPKIF